MLNNYRELKLPPELCQQLEAKYLGAHFATLEDLVTFVLQELVREEALQMDAAEEKIVEQRLRDLGYF